MPTRDVFSAIADPTRRKLLDLLAESGELPLHEMAAKFKMGRTGVSKHLGILKEAGLVEDRKVGRESLYHLDAARLRDVQRWVSFYEQFWTQRVDRLKSLLGGAEDMGETVTLDFELTSPIGRVWHALTDSATLCAWMMFDTEDFQAVVGHRFQFHAKPSTGWDGTIDCEVLEVEEPHRLSYTWETDGQIGRHQTTVTWTLTESGGVTRLHLEQSGFDSGARQEIGGATYGWTHQLGQLKNLLSPQDNPGKG